MLTSFQDVILILGYVALSLLFLWVLQRRWPGTQRNAHNDIIGWQLSVLGTTYAVIIGFMLYAVWTAFQAAEINADNEANSLVNVYRLADGLPQDSRIEVHRLAREYADTVVTQEWPAMHRGEIDLAGAPVIERLWAAVARAKPASFGEQTSMSLTLNEISNMTRCRRIREVESESKLPGILWVVMILGGLLTTVFASLFGTSNMKLHTLQLFSISLMIILILVSIADIDRPFQGAVHVRPLGFERARDTFAQIPVDTP